MKNKNDYYKAYEKRYSQVYDSNMLWSTTDATPEVVKFLQFNNADLNSKILDLGCGEGRDAINLLKQGYNVMAVDYSQTVINKCKELGNNLYNNKFKQFDLLVDKIEERFDYIYSIAVLHMFVLDEHRNKYWKFIRNHLEENGKALICVLGDGKKQFSSNIDEAFKNTNRLVQNNDTEIQIATTSCRIVDWEKLEEEVLNNGLNIEKKWISDTIPEFNPSMCIIVKRS